MKKIVVIGGAGFIGSHLVDKLIEDGYQVDVIDDLSAGKIENVNSKAVFHQVNICNYEDIEAIVSAVDYVFLLAALPRVQYSIEHPRETHEVNVTGLLNVLIAAQKGGVKRVISSSSSAVYGDSDVLPVREDMSVNPLSPYALHKYIGENYCRLFGVLYNLHTVSLRYFNVYGDRQDPNGPYALVIGKFLQQHTDGMPLTITGNGEQTRDFIHVRDVVAANILAMESTKVQISEVINIGSGDSCSINRLAEIIGGDVVHVESRVEPKNTLADISKAFNILGWRPRVNLTDGIGELMKYSGQ